MQTRRNQSSLGVERPIRAAKAREHDVRIPLNYSLHSRFLFSVFKTTSKSWDSTKGSIYSGKFSNFLLSRFSLESRRKLRKSKSKYACIKKNVAYVREGISGSKDFILDLFIQVGGLQIENSKKLLFKSLIFSVFALDH